MTISYGWDSPYMHRCEPIRRHIEQAGRDEEGKDIRQETVCGGLEDASWCLNKSGVHASCL